MLRWLYSKLSALQPDVLIAKPLLSAASGARESGDWIHFYRLLRQCEQKGSKNSNIAMNLSNALIEVANAVIHTHPNVAEDVLQIALQSLDSWVFESKVHATQYSTVLSYLANTSLQLGNTKDACECSERALDVYTSVVGTEDERFHQLKENLDSVVSLIDKETEKTTGQDGWRLPD